MRAQHFPVTGCTADWQGLGIALYVVRVHLAALWVVLDMLLHVNYIKACCTNGSVKLLVLLAGQQASVQAGAAMGMHPHLSYAPCSRTAQHLTPAACLLWFHRCQKVASVFAHASPENKAATGPVERFVAMLHNPVYAPLVNHMHSETVQRLQPSETTYMEVVRVTPQPGSPGGSAPMLYMWIVSRQGEGSNWHNCWMTDAVQLVQMDHLPV